MRPGLVSVTFRQLSPEHIIDWARRAELAAIEWGGDIHVPHGETETARRVGQMTRGAGLEVAAYGSYYQVGMSEEEGLNFEVVLASAVALGAPTIRVWAGNSGTDETDEPTFQHIVAETQRICERAEKEGVVVAFEFHGVTLTDSGTTARRLLEAVNHPRLKSLWQPRVDATIAERVNDLHLLAPWLLNLHVFHWQQDTEGKRERLPLVQGEAEWQSYLQAAKTVAKPQYALLEFVRDDDPAQLMEDGATLRNWCEETNRLAL